MTGKWRLFRLRERRGNRPELLESAEHVADAKAPEDVTPWTAEEDPPNSGEPLEFDEEWYLQRNPDVAEVVQEGGFKSGLEHYLVHGCNEGRLPVPQKRDS
jgi:hypothetical protein